MIMTDELFGEFKRRYKRAKKAKKKVFSFLDQEVLVTYAKYVVEYNENFRKVDK